MSLREFIDTAYAVSVEALRDAGLSLNQAVEKIDELIRPVATDPMVERIYWAKKNVASYQRLQSMTGVSIGRRRTPEEASSL